MHLLFIKDFDKMKYSINIQHLNNDLITKIAKLFNNNWIVY